jgi:hypothetical protein
LRGLPVIPFADKATTHPLLGSLEEFARADVIYHSCPPHTTHRLQPIDVSWARSFKTFFTKLFQSWFDQTEWAFEVCGGTFARDSEAQKVRVTFVTAMCGGSHQATTAYLSQNAFRACGLVRWDPQQVLKPPLVKPWAGDPSAEGAGPGLDVRTASTTAHASSRRRRHARSCRRSSRSGGSERPTYGAAAGLAMRGDVDGLRYLEDEDKQDMAEDGEVTIPDVVAEIMIEAGRKIAGQVAETDREGSERRA